MNCCRRYSKRPASGQRGAALIISVFVLALGMVMITALSTRFVVAARRTDNQLMADQAWFYLTAAEQLATEMLLVQLKDRQEQQANTLYRPEMFGQYDTDDGWLAFNVLDLQGRFNLNNLSGGGAGGQGGSGRSDAGEGEAESDPPPTPAAGVPNTAPVPRNIWQKRFIRLLLSLEQPQLTENDALALTEALLDWQDSDVLETGFGGAEEAFYADQPLPYRPADAPMRDVSELLLVKGMTPELYQVLSQLVTVWPREGAPLSIAGVQRPLIQALYDSESNLPMEAEEAEILWQALQGDEITTLEEFLQRPEWGGAGLKQDQLVGSSDVFLIQSRTRVGRIEQALDSVIIIRNDKAEVLARSLQML